MYHVNYEKLIFEFSALCKESDVEKRLCGAKGLHAIVRKMAGDGLAGNIWKPELMNRTISGLLFCLSRSTRWGSNESNERELSGLEAEICMSDLMSIATFGQVTSVLNSIFNYLNEKNLWNDRQFTNFVYCHVINSIQSRYWHTIVINAISHLEESTDATAATRRNQLKVLSTLLELVKSQTVGPLMFEYLNFLFAEISRLSSIESLTPDEQLYARDLMDCLEIAVSRLEDFESIEVMVFLAGKMLTSIDYEEMNTFNNTFNCLYFIAQHYKNDFPITLMKPLLRLMSDPVSSEKGQTIFHTLLDLQGNLSRVGQPSYSIQIKSSQSSQANRFLIQKYGCDIYTSILIALQFGATRSPTYSKTVYKTLAVLAAYQVPSDIAQYFACLYIFQEKAVSDAFNVPDRVSFLIATLGLFICASEIAGLSKLAEHGRQLVVHRRYHSPILVEGVTQLKFGIHFDECCLLNEECLRCLLEECCPMADSDLCQIVGQMRDKICGLGSTSRLVVEGDIIARSTVNLQPLQVQDSTLSVKGRLIEDLNFTAMKKIVTVPVEETRKFKAIRSMEIRNKFATWSLNDIAESFENEELEETRHRSTQIINQPESISETTETVLEELEKTFPDIFY